MRVLFCTQAEGLHMFDAVAQELRRRGSLERTGYTVADQLIYHRWLSANPNFESANNVVLKEWEVTADRHRAPDLAALARYEAQIGGVAGLFGAIVADRRLFMGKDCTYSQDYRRRFSDNELLSILLRAIEDMEKLFDELQPDVVCGFICVTMLDYLAYLFAKARGVRVLNMRPTRVGDFVTLGSTLNDPSPEFAAAYASLQQGVSSPNMERAKAHVARVREQHGRYEGVVKPSDRPALNLNARGRSPIARLLGLWRNWREYRRVAGNDNHVPDPLRNMMFAGLINPLRARRVRSRLAASYMTRQELKQRRYIFYPLHTEPEVSLLVYGRPYVNQIEVIRWLAMSMPVDCVLVVKEHPWMVGKRTWGAYQKMLNIPRVRLCDPKMEARELISNASAVAVVTGSVALEAAILRKPVLTFGDCPYNLLPTGMLRRCDDPRALADIMSSLIGGYECDESALENYICAVMDTSVPLNLYSVLLGKKNVHAERSSGYQDEAGKLAAHILERAAQQPIVSPAPGSSAW